MFGRLRRDGLDFGVAVCGRCRGEPLYIASFGADADAFIAGEELMLSSTAEAEGIGAMADSASGGID